MVVSTTSTPLLGGLIGGVVQYMDRTYVRQFNRTAVYERGMEIWTEEVVRTTSVGGQLLRIFLENVAADRSGEPVARGTLQDVTKMMLELGRCVYVEELETPFLAESKAFFQYVLVGPENLMRDQLFACCSFPCAQQHHACTASLF
jgi:hypothetical protein